MQMGQALGAAEKQHATSLLASLQLPHLFIVLSASGREICRRLGCTPSGENAVLPLRQMRELNMLPACSVQLDATPPVLATARKLTRLLNDKVFRVVTTEVQPNFDGMEHLCDALGEAAGFTDLQGAVAYAAERGFPIDTTAEGI